MKKLCLLGMAVIVSLICVHTAKGLDLKALQEELHRLGDPWVAGKTCVSDLSFEEKRKLCGAKLPPGAPGPMKMEEISKTSISYWDWRDKDGKNYMTPPKSQGNCGSCTHFATIGLFEAALKIANDVSDYNYNLSEQFMLSCGPGSCSGGQIGNVVGFAYNTGCPDEGCFPYTSGSTGNSGNCNDRCSDWRSRLEKVVNRGNITSNVKAKLQEGPLATVMTVYEDFMDYRGGVYSHVTGSSTELHAIVIIGWDDANNCWIGKNSWSTYWGEDGYFRIKYGECGVGSGGWWWLKGKKDTSPRVVLIDDNFNIPGDGIWDPDEAPISIIVDIENIGVDAANAQGVLSTNDPYVNITSNTFDFGPVAHAIITDNSANPYLAKVTSSPSTEPYLASFNLHLTADGGYSKDYELTEAIGLLPGKIRHTLDTLPRTEPANGMIYGMAYNGTHLWVSEWQSAFLFKLDPHTGETVSQIPTPTNDSCCTGISWDGTNNALWVHSSITKKIYLVDPLDGSILNEFSSPATKYPTGLCFDGKHLWAVDRDEYKIYKLTTSGSQIGGFDVPISPKPEYGPRCLAFEPDGPDGGSLLLVMTHFRIEEDTLTFNDSTVVYEISRNGSLISNHHFEMPPINGRAVEVNPHKGEYWVNNWVPAKIYKVFGFYRSTQGVEEPVSYLKISDLTVSPNPSQHKISISFYVPDAREVSINIYDIAGKLVCSLVDGMQETGNHKITWNGKNNNGREVTSGIYFCRLTTGDSETTRKVLLVR